MYGTEDPGNLHLGHQSKRIDSPGILVIRVFSMYLHAASNFFLEAKNPAFATLLIVEITAASSSGNHMSHHTVTQVIMEVQTTLPHRDSLDELYSSLNC